MSDCTARVQQKKGGGLKLMLIRSAFMRGKIWSATTGDNMPRKTNNDTLKKLIQTCAQSV